MHYPLTFPTTVASIRPGCRAHQCTQVGVRVSVRVRARVSGKVKVKVTFKVRVKVVIEVRVRVGSSSCSWCPLGGEYVFQTRIW